MERARVNRNTAYDSSVIAYDVARTRLVAEKITEYSSPKADGSDTVYFLTWYNAEMRPKDDIENKRNGFKPSLKPYALNFQTQPVS
jgi:hypothetical protein